MFKRKKYILIEPNDSADGSSGSVMRALDAKPASNPVRSADLPSTGSVIDPTLVAYQLDTLLSYAGQVEDETAAPACRIWFGAQGSRAHLQAGRSAKRVRNGHSR